MPNFDDITADFDFLDDWDDRYKYLIDLGRELSPYPEDKRVDAYKVKGCASQVWLFPEIDRSGPEPVLRLAGDSDAHIVKGLVAVLLALYSGRTLTDAASIDPGSKLEALDLSGHLTPQRSNGLASMIKQIQDIARSA